jgi:hypothetical protein
MIAALYPIWVGNSNQTLWEELNTAGADVEHSHEISSAVLQSMQIHETCVESRQLRNSRSYYCLVIPCKSAEIPINNNTNVIITSVDASVNSLGFPTVVLVGEHAMLIWMSDQPKKSSTFLGP